MNNDTLTKEADPMVRYSELRKATDYSIAPSLILAAVVSWILWTLYLTERIFRPIAVFTGLSRSIALGAVGLPAFVATVFVSHLVYLIVNRRNEHFRRSESLLWAAIGRLKNSTNSADTARLFAINTAERDLLGTSVEEKERSAYLWGLLSLIPYMGVLFLSYALLRVNSDFQKHEQREFATIEDIQRALGLLVGYTPAQTKRWYPSRDSFAYFVASIGSVGLFSIYWLYVATSDPKAHFEVQSHLENEIQSLISGVKRPGQSSSIGGVT
jgi:hypothetical protein